MKENIFLLSLSLMLGVSSVYLGGGLLYDWLIPSGRVAFIEAGGPLHLVLTDLNFLVSGIGLLIFGSLIGLALTLDFVALARGVGEA